MKVAYTPDKSVILITEKLEYCQLQHMQQSKPVLYMHVENFIMVTVIHQLISKIQLSNPVHELVSSVAGGPNLEGQT